MCARFDMFDADASGAQDSPLQTTCLNSGTLKDRLELVQGAAPGLALRKGQISRHLVLAKRRHQIILYRLQRVERDIAGPALAMIEAVSVRYRRRAEHSGQTGGPRKLRGEIMQSRERPQHGR